MTVRCVSALSEIAQVNSGVSCSVLGGTCTTFERQLTGYSEPPFLGGARGAFYSNEFAASAGVPCGSGTHVVLEMADYNTLRAQMDGVTNTDVALLVPAIALTWAVAWLCKRAVRILIPHA